MADDNLDLPPRRFGVVGAATTAAALFGCGVIAWLELRETDLPRAPQPGATIASEPVYMEVRVPDEPAIPQMARNFDPDMNARNAGILGVVQQESGHFLASPYGGAFAVGNDDENVWGGLGGTEVGDAHGVADGAHARPHDGGSPRGRVVGGHGVTIGAGCGRGRERQVGGDRRVHRGGGGVDLLRAGGKARHRPAHSRAGQQRAARAEAPDGKAGWQRFGQHDVGGGEGRGVGERQLVGDFLAGQRSGRGDLLGQRHVRTRAARVELHVVDIPAVQAAAAVVAKLQAQLAPYAEQVREARKLAEIVTDLPVTLNLADCAVAGYDRGKVVVLFRELGFRSLLGRLPGTPPAAAEGGERRTGDSGQLGLFSGADGATADAAPGRGGLDHFCLSIRCADLGAVRYDLLRRGVTVEGDVVERRGAYGTGPSLYLRDPDGYVIELEPRGA